MNNLSRPTPTNSPIAKKVEFGCQHLDQNFHSARTFILLDLIFHFLAFNKNARIDFAHGS